MNNWKIRELASRDRLITVKVTRSHLHIYLETIRQWLREKNFGKGEYLSEVFFPPHSLTDNHKGAHSHGVERLRPDLSDHSALAQLHRYWRVLNVSIASWNKTSVHAAESKTITEPEFCLQNSKIKRIVCTFLFISRAWSKKNLILKGNKEGLILHTGAGRFIEACFDSNTANLKEIWFLVHDNAHAHCAMTVKRFVGNGEVMETIHPPFTPDHFSGAFFLFAVVKNHLQG